METQRASSQALWRQRAEKSALSQKLWLEHDKAGAKVASEAAHALEQQARAADAAAAAAIFAHKQQRVLPSEVDLHGLHVEEAKGFLAARLEAERTAGTAFLVVIYGRGHHSADHRTHIKPAVLEMMRGKGLEVREGWHAALGHGNEGVCTVTLCAAAKPAVDAPEPLPPPSFDSGLRIKLPQEQHREADQAPRQPDAGLCCIIM